MPICTCPLLKFQKPALSLKQFMLRSEVLKLYRGFMKLSRLMDTSSSFSEVQFNNDIPVTRNRHPLQIEWINWVRAEFRLRQDTTDEEGIKMMLAHGKRQLQEMERTILLATNRNPQNIPDSSNNSNVNDNSNSNADVNVSNESKNN